MKNIFILCPFLLVSITAQSQSLKSGLTKTVNAINGLLVQNKIVHFTNQDYALFYPTKINANLQGDLFCVERSTRFGAEKNGLMFNVLQVKSFVINGDNMKALDKNQETIVEIYHSSSQERQTLIKELDALRFICKTYSELDPKFKCD